VYKLVNFNINYGAKMEKEKIKYTTLSQIKEQTNKLDKARMCTLHIDDGGVMKEVKKFKGIYNISKGEFTAAVVPYYNLVQHKDYFDHFAVALDKLGIKCSMIFKQSGSRAFCDIDFVGRNIKYTNLNEEFTTGIRLVNSYNKSTGLHIMPRFTRLACTNGMILTRSEQTISIKHHSKIVKEIQIFVEKKLNEIINKNEDLKIWVSTSMKDSAEWLVCSKILEKLFIHLNHREEVLKRLNISVIKLTDKKTKKKSIGYVYDGKEKKKKFTRWELYNAVTSYITHGEQITPHIESVLHKYAEKLLVTPLKKMPIAKVVL